MEYSLDRQLESIIKDSQIKRDYIRTREIDSSFGWREPIKVLAETIPRKGLSGLLLTGPDGCGRHTAAMQLIQAIKGRYEPYFLTGTDFCSAADPRELLNALVDRCYSDDKGLLLALDLPESHPSIHEIYNQLATLCCEFSLQEGVCSPLFVVLISETEKHIPALLLSQMYHIRFALPDQELRREFFSNKLKNYIDADLAAEETDGCSFHQLVNLVKTLELQMDAYDLSVIKKEQLHRLVHRENDSDSNKNIFYRKASEMMDTLPLLVEKLSSAPASVQPVPVPTPAPESAPAEEQITRQDIEKMPVSDLCVELFGEERYQQLLN